MAMNAAPAKLPLEAQKGDAHIDFPNSHNNPTYGFAPTDKAAAGKSGGIIPHEIAEGHDFFNTNKPNKYMAALKPLKQANLVRAPATTLFLSALYYYDAP